MSNGLVKRIGLGNNIQKRKVKVYDVEQKKLINEFDSLSECSKFYGIKDLTSYINNKCRCYKNNTGRVLAFR